MRLKWPNFVGLVGPHGQNTKETGIRSDTEILDSMGQFNAALIEAGIMVDGSGVKPSSQGKRVRFDGESHTANSGPLQPVTELVAG